MPKAKGKKQRPRAGNKLRKHFEKYSPMWKLMSKANGNEKMRKALISSLKEEDMHEIRKLMQAVMEGKLGIPPEMERELAKDKRDIHALANASLPKGKRILRQNGGFLGAIAGALIGPLISTLAKPVVGLFANALKPH